jgi:cytochrome bd-type quinol oxidase subunit 2
MYRLLRQLWEICLLRAGPQDLPYSPALARGLVALLIGVNLLYSATGPDTLLLPRILVAVGVLLGVTWIALTTRDRTPRYAQAVTALCGCTILFLLALMPLTWLLFALQPDPASAEALPQDPRRVALALLAVLLLGWKVMVNGHIFRHALDWPYGAGILLALGIFMLQQGLDQLLFRLPV